MRRFLEKYVLRGLFDFGEVRIRLDASDMPQPIFRVPKKRELPPFIWDGYLKLLLN